MNEISTVNKTQESKDIDEFLVRTFLPVTPRFLITCGGREFPVSTHHAIYQRFVPPSRILSRQLARSYSEFSSEALLSPSYRRELRRWHMYCLTPICAEVRPWCQGLVKELVPEGVRQYDPSCGRKFIDIEREIDEYFEKDACERVESVPEDGLLLDKSREADKQTLLWELCLTGETGRKAGTIRRDSPVWTLLGIDPDELMTLSPQDAATIVLFSLLKLTGIGAKAPDEASLQKLWTWFTETHLPSEEPKETTDHALKCAADVGLVHPMETIFDEESGEPVGETEVEDRGSTRFVRHVEAKDDLNRIVARVKLSRSEQLVLMGMREGFIGEELENWVEGQGQGVERSSVPVLATRVRTKLRAAARQ